MNDIKNLYEFTLVASVKLGENTEEIINKFKNLIETNAELIDVKRWGKKKFAYLINKEAEGEYVFFEFKSDSQLPKEIDRISQITDGVLRSMVIKKELN